MANTFQYVESDFGPNGADAGRLNSEIAADASIGSALLWVEKRPTAGVEAFAVRVKFDRELTAPEEGILDGLIAAHDPSVALPPGFLLAELDAKQPGVTPGRTAFARDVRKAGEGAGAGTGALLYSDGAAWLRARDDLPPTV